MQVTHLFVQWLALQTAVQHRYPFAPTGLQEVSAMVGRLQQSELEQFLPQLCAIMVAHQPPQVPSSYAEHAFSDLNKKLEAMLLERSQKCLDFGVKLNWQLQASAQGPVSERVQALLASSEQSAKYGRDDFLPDALQTARGMFYEDFSGMMGYLNGLSQEMRSKPLSQRNDYLWKELERFNYYLFSRMLHRGPWAGMEVPPDKVSLATIVNLCPDILKYSLLSPLSSSDEPAHRLLRIYVDECKTLSSKERCPFLICMETVETAFNGCDPQLYAGQNFVGISLREMLSDWQDQRLKGNPSTPDKQRNGKEQPWLHKFMPAYQRSGVSRARAATEPLSKLHIWDERRRMIRQSSPFRHLPGWCVQTAIVKVGDDVRKDELAMQFMTKMLQIFQQHDLPIYLRPYKVICTGHETGLIEYIEDAISIDHIKRHTPGYTSLQRLFEERYGGPHSPLYRKAVQNFLSSLVGYSLLTYVLQVKDRHNANILLDHDGRIVHIDYGFVLGESPGSWGFEGAPFKLTKEYVDLLGGQNSELWLLFERLFVQGFRVLQQRIADLEAIVMAFYCKDDKRQAALQLRSRLQMLETDKDILNLIRDSVDSWRTQQYDWYQQQVNGISR